MVVLNLLRSDLWACLICTQFRVRVKAALGEIFIVPIKQWGLETRVNGIDVWIAVTYDLQEGNLGEGDEVVHSLKGSVKDDTAVINKRRIFFSFSFSISFSF